MEPSTGAEMGKGQAWGSETLCPFFPRGPFSNLLVRDVGQESTQGTQPLAGLRAHLPNPASWPDQ